MRVMLDTDLSMGEIGSEIDDGLALALAIASPSLEVIGVGTVHGNTSACAAARMTQDLLGVLDRPDIPVYEGCHRPLLWPTHLPAAGGDDFGCRHGGTSAAVAMVESARRWPGELTVIAIGPLTNVAMAILLAPDFVDLLGGLVVMGGVYTRSTGQRARPGEFNFWVDPHAAKIVLGSGIGPRLVGLDVTNDVRMTHADAETLGRARPFGAYAAEYVHAWIDHLRAEKPRAKPPVDSCAMHDPLAVAVTASPDLVRWRQAHVDVSADSATTRGMAVADFLEGVSAPAPNCEVAVAVDRSRFSSELIAALSSL